MGGGRAPPIAGQAQRADAPCTRGHTSLHLFVSACCGPLGAMGGESVVPRGPTVSYDAVGPRVGLRNSSSHRAPLVCSVSAHKFSRECCIRCDGDEGASWALRWGCVFAGSRHQICGAARWRRFTAHLASTPAPGFLAAPGISRDARGEFHLKLEVGVGGKAGRACCNRYRPADRLPPRGKVGKENPPLRAL